MTVGSINYIAYRFVWDFIAAICWIKNVAISFVWGVSVAATFVAGFGDKIGQPVVKNVFVDGL